MSCCMGILSSLIIFQVTQDECHEYDGDEEESDGDEDLSDEDEEEFDVNEVRVVEEYETKISNMYLVNYGNDFQNDDANFDDDDQRTGGDAEAHVNDTTLDEQNDKNDA
uniref:Uncharacterized protein n=1 Tax=Lactuca sativa TaxID=4236 RepID=A0A9R1WNJ5_LACSA|nr:hypothetical protein LSAT_V11C100035670 [Lactuca sativa]